jgi:pimeloyl-ACP methyl ester carboxylesterase
LHAGIADHRSFGVVLDLLSPDMDVVAYDRRRFGATAYKRERHDQLVDLSAVLDAVMADRAVLVGNSQGAEIALNAALVHPRRVSALVLIAPSVSGSPPVDASAVTPVEAAIWENLESAQAAGATDALNLGEIRLWLDGPSAPEGRVGGKLRQLALDMNRIALGAVDPGTEPQPPDAWHRLSEVRCPTLAVVGDRDLGHVQARAHFLADQITGAQLAVMPGTAHLPAFEQPEAFSALLRDFL